jgi:hypothetical protein
MADMSRPALSVVLLPSSPVGPFVNQDATFTSSVTSPVVAILSLLIGAETALSIERELREADQREADQRRVNRLYPLQEEPPPANVPSQSTSSELLLMPNLNHDEDIDNKVDKAVVETLAIELLAGLKLKDAAQQTNKKKAGSKRKQRNKPTLEEKIFDKKKPASNNTKQSKLPLQPPQTPEKTKNPKQPRRVSLKRAETLAESQLSLEPLQTPEQPKIPKKKRNVPPRNAKASKDDLARQAVFTRKEALARQDALAKAAYIVLKTPPVYSNVASAPKVAAAPSGNGGGGDNSMDSEDNDRVPIAADDTSDLDKRPAARNLRPKSTKKKYHRPKLKKKTDLRLKSTKKKDTEDDLPFPGSDYDSDDSLGETPTTAGNARPRSLKKKPTREIKSVQEGQLLYNRSLALQARRNEEKGKEHCPTFMEPPTKLTDTDAYFNYLEHQTELHHTETIAQRTKDYKRVSSDVRRSMTPTKIWMIKLQKREEQEAIQAARKETQDHARRAEEERLEEKERETEPARKQAEILYRKHFDSTHINWERRGSTVEKKRSQTLFTNVTKHFRDIQTRDKRDEERVLKALPREEMTEEQKYEADILQLDSLMYIPAEVGDRESASQKNAGEVRLCQGWRF